MENDDTDMFEDDQESPATIVQAVGASEIISETPIVIEDNSETLNEHPSTSNAVNNPIPALHVHDAVVVTSTTSTVPSDNDLNTTAEDFVPGTITISEPKDDTVKVKKQSKGKKRKAAESVESADNEEGSVCTICFEDWSNSGEHRIASLKCGHFFGYQCIEKWLKGSGSSCPNCNEKNTKKDIRVHFVSKLAAIDTSERDRALKELETVRTELREVQLRETEVNVRLKLQQEKIDQLETDIRRYRERGGELPSLSSTNLSRLSSSSDKNFKLVLVKRHEVCRPSTDRDKCCRVLAVSEYQGMIIVSQPSANPLFPGYGARRFNMLDQKLGSFVSLGKEIIRDMKFHPVTPELLLSCGQEKVVRVTNMVSCSEVRHTYMCSNWSISMSVSGDEVQD